MARRSRRRPPSISSRRVYPRFMPELIASPTRIPVPGNKLVEEYIGRVNSSTEGISVAHMHSPAGWTEPGQRPDFDEYTVVLAGVMHVDHESGTMDIAA